MQAAKGHFCFCGRCNCLVRHQGTCIQQGVANPLAPPPQWSPPALVAMAALPPNRHEPLAFLTSPSRQSRPALGCMPPLMLQRAGQWPPPPPSDGGGGGPLIFAPCFPCTRRPQQLVIASLFIGGNHMPARLSGFCTAVTTPHICANPPLLLPQPHPCPAACAAAAPQRQHTYTLAYSTTYSAALTHTYGSCLAVGSMHNITWWCPPRPATHAPDTYHVANMHARR